VSAADLPWKALDGPQGKIRFEIIKKEPSKNGSTCYVILVRELFGSFADGVPIQEYSGFYSKQKDKFILYPRKYKNQSFLEYPFTRHEVSPFWVRDLTQRSFEDVDENVSLDKIFGL